MGLARTVALALSAGAAVTGVACSRAAPATDDPFVGMERVTRYSCIRVLSLRVTLNATSASVTIDNDGPYTLPQTGARTDMTTYSDGQRTLTIARGQVYLTLGRMAAEQCTRS
jgi:hypothetical protein